MAPDEHAGTWTIMTAAGKGAKVASFVVSWAVVLHELDADEITVEEYIAAGYDARRTTFRRLADFRDLFPEEEGPNRLARMLRSAAAEARERPSAALAIAV